MPARRLVNSVVSNSTQVSAWLLAFTLASSHWTARRAWGEAESEPVVKKLLTTTLTVRAIQNTPQAPVAVERPAIVATPAATPSNAPVDSVDPPERTATTHRESSIQKEAVNGRSKLVTDRPGEAKQGRENPRLEATANRRARLTESNSGKAGQSKSPKFAAPQAAPSPQSTSGTSAFGLNQTPAGPARPAEPTATSGPTLGDGLSTQQLLPAPGSVQQQDAPAQVIDSSSNLFRNGPQNVTVTSGVSVGEGCVVTFTQVASPRSSPPQFRVTLPDGEQAAAELRVVDQYSGLSLLKLKQVDLDSFKCAITPPEVGDTVYTAAASGIEPPTVSRGIVSGTERALNGTGLPPLLLCDVRTTETSSGAPIVNDEGLLVGVIAAAGAPSQMSNWAYALPAEHVNRLLAAQKPGEVVVLPRQRPTVGLQMGPGDEEGTVEVQHVLPGGPAEQAGFRKGDIIVEAEGRKIRSAYQAVDLIMARQPGDKVEFLVEQNGEQRKVDVLLGGAAEASSLRSGGGGIGGHAVVPQIRMQIDKNGIQVQNGIDVGDYQSPAGGAAGIIADTRNDLSVPTDKQKPSPQPTAVANETEVRSRLGRFERSVLDLNERLSQREKELAEAEGQLIELRKEVRQLRAKLSEPSKAAKPTTPPRPTDAKSK